MKKTPPSRDDHSEHDETAGRERPAVGEVSRRSVLRWGALAGAGASLGGWAGGEAGAADWGDLDARADFPLQEATIADFQRWMEQGRATSRALVQRYLVRINVLDRRGPGVNSVIETNPDALALAAGLDLERRQNGPRGPLHGIPVLLKDNIDTADEMQTAAGSLALVGQPPLQDATVAQRLRAAGAVILGKANLSEWANFRGFESSSGWCGRAGQCNNPYVLDRNPCGSSSGSAASVSANFSAVSLGTETDGSIVCPSSACGVVGIKPTVGLTSRAGVVPIAATQDTVGPHGRTLADAATVLGALTGVDPRDPATQASAGNFFTDYTQFLDPGSLQGARIGVARDAIFGSLTVELATAFEEALQAMRDAGATVIDPAPIPSAAEFAVDDSEIIVLVFEFKRDLNAYLATRAGVPVGDMADVIAFNLANAEAELQFFGQEWFELAQAEIFSEADYQQALATGPRLAGPEGIDAALALNDLDVLVAPTNSPAWPSDLVNGDAFLMGTSAFAAVAGYPLVTVPSGSAFGLPLGITFMAGAWSEPTLIRIASGFEAVTQTRVRPGLLPTLDLGGRPGAKAAAGGLTPLGMRRADALRETLLRRTRGLSVRPRFL